MCCSVDINICNISQNHPIVQDSTVLLLLFMLK